jgi:uncharacterized metal-binding protein
MSSDLPGCAACPFDWPERACAGGNRSPAGCPTRTDHDLVEQARELLVSGPDAEFARQASIQECEGYGARDEGHASVRPIKTRIEEIAEFASRIGCKRLGLAFCIGLRREAGIVHRMLASRGFEVASVLCKAGRLPKQDLGLTREQHIDTTASFEPMCNPVLQAMLLNRSRTSLNVLLGLCVGHDSLFLRHARAYCTVLAVKDRVLGHNPLAAVYQYESYYRYLDSDR